LGVTSLAGINYSSSTPDRLLASCQNASPRRWVYHRPPEDAVVGNRSIGVRISALHIVDDDNPVIAINMIPDAPIAYPAAQFVICPTKNFHITTVGVVPISTNAASICSTSSRGMSRIARRAD